MNERINKAREKAVEFWNKYNNKQRALMIGVTIGVIVLMVVLYSMFTKPSYIVLVESSSADTISDVKEELGAAGIKYKISNAAGGGYVVKVEKKDKINAEMAIATSGVIAHEYTIDQALSGGMTTTEADKEKRYKAYIEDKLRVSLENLDYIKAAKVQITVPESKLSVLDSDEESTAAVVLKLKNSIDTEVAENIAQWIATSLGNKTTASITIIDTEGNMLFRGTDYYTADGSMSNNSQAEMKNAAMDLVATNVKKLFKEAELYQSVEVSSYLDMSFDNVEVTNITHSVTDEDGDGQGPYTSSYTVTQEGASGVGGVPGTDSNDEDITYEINTGDNSTSTYELTKYEYAVNQLIEKTTKERGLIDYNNSTLSIVARTYNVFDEKKVKEQDLLEDMTWDQFKEANRENVSLEVPEELYDLVANATGFERENITILAYRVPQFVDAETPKSTGFTDYVPIILAVLIFALFAFVVFKSTRPVQVIETEENLSVEQLLSSTKAVQQPVEDIDLNDKSDTRKAIEKFVDENPEAVALLLRNWLEDDWG